MRILTFLILNMIMLYLYKIIIQKFNLTLFNSII